MIDVVPESRERPERPPRGGPPAIAARCRNTREADQAGQAPASPASAVRAGASRPGRSGRPRRRRPWPWRTSCRRPEEQPPAETCDHDEPGIHPGLARVNDQQRAEGRQPGRPEPGRGCRSGTADPPDQPDRHDAAQDAEARAAASDVPNTAIQTWSNKGCSGARVASIWNSRSTSAAGFPPGQPHRHDLVVPEAELAELPAQAGRDQDDRGQEPTGMRRVRASSEIGPVRSRPDRRRAAHDAGHGRRPRLELLEVVEQVGAEVAVRVVPAVADASG